jgi:hypothetical protein
MTDKEMKEAELEFKALRTKRELNKEKEEG